MFTCLRMSDAASMALHTMDIMARSPGRLVSNQEIADTLGVSANHLSKVHQRLERVGLVKSTRGPGGGFRLGPAADTIRLIAIVEAVDGPYQPVRCLLGREKCLRDSCLLGGLTERLNRQVMEFLQETTVADLATSGTRVEDLAQVVSYTS